MLQPIPISAFSIQPLVFRLARVPATVLLLCLGALSALGQSGVHMAKGRADSVSAAFSAEQPAGLRSAVEDLMATFRGRYPRGSEFLARLREIEPRLRASADLEARTEFAALQREALIANPLVSGQPILYIVRPQYRSSYHAIDTLFHTCLLYTSPSPRDRQKSRMPSSA